MPETNLISLMFINLNSVQSNASDARWNSTQFCNVYFTTAPYKRFFKLFVQFTCYNCWKNPQTSRTFSFCCIQFSQQYSVRLLFDLNATAAISVDSVHQEIIPFTFCSNRVNCYAVQEILLNRKKKWAKILLIEWFYHKL